MDAIFTSLSASFALAAALQLWLERSGRIRLQQPERY